MQLLLKQEAQGSGCLQDSWSSQGGFTVKQQNANGLLFQRIEASNCSSCPLYHAKVVCGLLTPVLLGYNSVLKCRDFNILWKSLLILSYDFSFIIFTIFFFLSIFLIPVALTWQVVFLSKPVSDKWPTDRSVSRLLSLPTENQKENPTYQKQCQS